MAQSQPLPHTLHVNQTSRFLRGGMHFGGSSRKGNMLAGGVKYMSGLNRFQADVAVGQFSGVNRDGTQTNGTGHRDQSHRFLSADGSTALQGRYTYVGQNFLSPQSGLHEPTNLAAGGVSWQPRDGLRQP